MLPRRRRSKKESNLKHENEGFCREVLLLLAIISWCTKYLLTGKRCHYLSDAGTVTDSNIAIRSAPTYWVQRPKRDYLPHSRSWTTRGVSSNSYACRNGSVTTQSRPGRGVRDAAVRVAFCGRADERTKRPDVRTLRGPRVRRSDRTCGETRPIGRRMRTSAGWVHRAACSAARRGNRRVSADDSVAPRDVRAPPPVAASSPSCAANGCCRTWWRSRGNAGTWHDTREAQRASPPSAAPSWVWAPTRQTSPGPDRTDRPGTAADRRPNVRRYWWSAPPRTAAATSGDTETGRTTPPPERWPCSAGVDRQADEAACPPSIEQRSAEVAGTGGAVHRSASPGGDSCRVGRRDEYASVARTRRTAAVGWRLGAISTPRKHSSSGHARA
mmetsp:Transcript_8348/g.25859  ORF Transcript_8348/g.25859 Transcript_8348/m.25859 type:complete len:385 (-) Transcript_8348:692-1846(-)